MEERDVRSEVESTILEVLDDLKASEPGSKVRKDCVDELNALGKIRSDEFRAEADQYDKELKLEIEQEKLKLEREKAETEKKHFGITTGLTIGGFLGYVWMFGHHAKSILKVEEFGAVTSKAAPLLKDLVQGARRLIKF